MLTGIVPSLASSFVQSHCWYSLLILAYYFSPIRRILWNFRVAEQSKDGMSTRAVSACGVVTLLCPFIIGALVSPISVILLLFDTISLPANDGDILSSVFFHEVISTLISPHKEDGAHQPAMARPARPGPPYQNKEAIPRLYGQRASPRQSQKICRHFSYLGKMFSGRSRDPSRL